MKVKELIELLSAEDPEMEVVYPVNIDKVDYIGLIDHTYVNDGWDCKPRKSDEFNQEVVVLL